MKKFFLLVAACLASAQIATASGGQPIPTSSMNKRGNCDSIELTYYIQQKLMTLSPEAIEAIKSKLCPIQKELIKRFEEKHKDDGQVLFSGKFGILASFLLESNPRLPGYDPKLTSLLHGIYMQPGFIETMETLAMDPTKIPLLTQSRTEFCENIKLIMSPELANLVAATLELCIRNGKIIELQKTIKDSPLAKEPIHQFTEKFAEIQMVISPLGCNQGGVLLPNQLWDHIFDPNFDKICSDVRKQIEEMIAVVKQRIQNIEALRSYPEEKSLEELADDIVGKIEEINALPPEQREARIKAIERVNPESKIRDLCDQFMEVDDFEQADRINALPPERREAEIRAIEKANPNSNIRSICDKYALDEAIRKLQEEKKLKGTGHV